MSIFIPMTWSQNPYPYPAFASDSHFYPQQPRPTIHSPWKENVHWSKLQCNRYTGLQTMEYEGLYFLHVLNKIKPISWPTLERVKNCKIPQIVCGLFLPPVSHEKLRASPHQKSGGGLWASIQGFNDPMSCQLQNPLLIFQSSSYSSHQQHWPWLISLSSLKTFFLSPSPPCPFSFLVSPCQWLCWFLLIFSNFQLRLPQGFSLSALIP